MNRKIASLMAGLQKEVGVTEISLSNGAILTKALGKPALIVLTAEAGPKINSQMEQTVTAYWGDSSPIKRHKFKFNGFSWGYAGEGPRGLFKYLTGLGVKTNMARISKIRAKELPVVFEV